MIEAFLWALGMGILGAVVFAAIGLVSGLEVDAEAMAANVPAGAGSERVLAALTARYGKHEAQARMHATIQPGAGRPGGLSCDRPVTVR